MWIKNNGTIAFTGEIPKKALDVIAEEEDIFMMDEEDASDALYFRLHGAGSHAVTVLEIEEADGDLSDMLNNIVEILAPYGIKPELDAHNHYYGDYDGCATCSATSLKR